MTGLKFSCNIRINNTDHVYLSYNVLSHVCVYIFSLYTPTFPISTADFVHLIGHPSTAFDNRVNSISEMLAN
jgi:hypothetical protein